MTSKIEKDDITKKEETKLKKALLIIRNILLLLSPLWVPFAYLGFFWLLEQLLPFRFFVDFRKIIGLIIFCLTPFIATIPIIKNKDIPKLLKVFVVPIYIFFGGIVALYAVVIAACVSFSGHCY